MSKILVIEDNEDIRNLIHEILSTEGFEVIDAENGEMGLTLAVNEIPDLILCDILMPELDGHGVIRQLHLNSYTCNIPFIFVSAKASISDISLGMEWGADSFLTKPFTINQLLTEVNSQLADHASPYFVKS